MVLFSDRFLRNYCIVIRLLRVDGASAGCCRLAPLSRDTCREIILGLREHDAVFVAIIFVDCSRCVIRHSAVH